MNIIKKAFSIIDTSLESAIVIVGVYWLNWVIDTRYIRIVSKGIEYNRSTIQTALWIVALAFISIITLLKYKKLKRKNLKVNIIVFIIADVVFVVTIQIVIILLCNKYNVINILYERM